MLVTTPLGRVRAARVALGTNAFPPLLRRIGHYIAPVYDYCMVTEPLTPEQLASIGWANRQGLSDIPNQFHYYRLTEDNRILWGGYDAVYYWRGKVSSELESRPSTWAKLSRHFFETFPQLDGVHFSHIWGGAIDTCTRFCVFWGTAMSGRVAYALGYTGLGVASTRFGADVMLDLLDGRRTVATSTQFVQRQAAAVPARAVPLRRHPGHAVVARPRGPHRQAQPVVALARPPRARVRLLSRRRGRPVVSPDMSLRWYTTVVDSPDPRALADWWAEALGWQKVYETRRRGHDHPRLRHARAGCRRCRGSACRRGSCS